jgi:hypothetical protein
MVRTSACGIAGAISSTGVGFPRTMACSTSTFDSPVNGLRPVAAS